MSDDPDFDSGGVIVHRVYDAVISYTNPPQIVGSAEFSRTGRTRICCKAVNFVSDPRQDLLRQPFQFLGGRPADPHLMHGV
jgi:hypothetical protein